MIVFEKPADRRPPEVRRHSDPSGSAAYSLRMLLPHTGTGRAMTTPNLEQIIAEHPYRINSQRVWCACGWDAYPDETPNGMDAHAAHVAAVICDSGLTVIELPEATYGDGTRIAFEYSEPRRADIHCTRCLREIEAYGQLVHRGLVAGHAWRHVDDKSTTCLGLYPTGNCRPHDDYDADRALAAQVAERNNHE